MKLFLLLFISGLSIQVFAQKEINWTKDQLMEPYELAASLKSSKEVPVIISVGPGALVPNSIVIGPASDSANLLKLKAQLQQIPKDKVVVVYCGCCPFEHCPNVRPAIAALKELNFTNYKLLNLLHNIKADWIDKGYPTEKL